MSEIISNSPEKNEILDDNARKFILDTLDESFLKEHNATSFLLTTDWLKTGEEDEEKLAYKQYTDGTVQILFIKKVTTNGNRTSVKEKITEEMYSELLERSLRRIEKHRYEFSYPQNGITFDLKYDEFTDSALRVLEVDAGTDALRNNFSATEFPTQLSEVTGDLSYYGYRVFDNLK